MPFTTIPRSQNSGRYLLIDRYVLDRVGKASE